MSFWFEDIFKVNIWTFI